MAPHSSILAWRIPWTEAPGGCSAWGRRAGHDRAVTAWYTTWHITRTAPTPQGILPEQNVATHDAGEAERRGTIKPQRTEWRQLQCTYEFGIQHITFFKFVFPSYDSNTFSLSKTNLLGNCN